MGLPLQRERGEGFLLDRLALAFVLAFAVVAAGLTASKFLWAPYFSWNDTRLAPSAALLSGYELYYASGEGPLLGHLYSPIAPLVYLPAALMPSPEAAIYLGTAIASLFFFGPAFLLLALEGAGAWRWTLAAFVVFFLFACYEPALGTTAFGIHVDAPALGFGALACAALYAPRRRRWMEWTSTLALVLAVGSKQVALPLVAALPLFLLISEGLRSALRYLGMLAVMGVAVLGSLALLVDFEAMWFNAVTVPMLNPWKHPNTLSLVLAALRELWIHSLPILIVIGLCLALGMQGAEPGKSPGGRAFIRANPWLLLFTVAALSVTTSVLGWVKVGGGANSLASPLYYGALGAALLALRMLAEGEREKRPNRVMGIKLGLLAVGSALAISLSGPLAEIGPLYAALDTNPERKAWEFAKAHPGAVYFPFNPLVNLMAEGRADHSTSGMLFQTLPGERVGPEHLQAHLPPYMRFIAFPGAKDYSEVYFPEYTRREEFSEIPGWSLLVR